MEKKQKKQKKRKKRKLRDKIDPEDSMLYEIELIELELFLECMRLDKKRKRRHYIV